LVKGNLTQLNCSYFVQDIKNKIGRVGRKRKREALPLNSLGSKIEKARKSLKLSQREVAEKVGLSIPALSKIESGATEKPDTSTLVSLVKFFRDNFGDSKLTQYLVQDGGREINVLGWVSAGRPIKPFQNEQVLSVPSEMISLTKQTFALQVQGESMKGVGILHGDIIVLHECPEPINGQVVVVRIDDEYTLKVWFKHGKKITLKPENEEFDNIEIEKGISEVQCLGEYAGLIRFAK